MKKVKSNETNKKTYLIMFFGIIIGVTISIVSSYVIAETLIKSADVSYVDNSKLGATNVQAAIDGTCTKFSNDLVTLQTTIINKIYPVGSIYISYDSTNPGTLFGGTWETFGKGQTLVGIDSSQTEFSTVGKTGGAKSVSTTLKETNLPSHSHVVPSLSGSTSTDGNHVHVLGNNLVGWGKNAGDVHFAVSSSIVEALPGAVSYGNPLIIDTSHNTMSTTGKHSHTVTTTESATTTCTNCNGTAFSTSTLQPYITVYMWKRTK